MSTRARRCDTRKRIQDVALELFAEQGYDKTSLREIAERIEVTKAALYYHFKTKEDIVLSIFEETGRPVEELCAWAREQPRTLQTKLEVIRRYSTIVVNAYPLFRFVQENQATVRDLRVGDYLKRVVHALSEVLTDDDATPANALRCTVSVFTLHAGMMGYDSQYTDLPLADRRAAALEVAEELLTRASSA